jgi:protein SCO1/2
MKLAILLALVLAPAAAVATPDAALFSWQQHPGAQVKLATGVRDEAGRMTTLGTLMGRMPVVLDLGYYHCPSLCGVVRADLFNAIAASGLTPGTDFSVLAVSIDPAETPEDAASAKAADLKASPAIPAASLHYLTAPEAGIKAIAGTIGFRQSWDPQYKQFIHPAGLVVLTKGGAVSSYLLGAGFTGGDLRAAVLRAGDGGIAQAALPILLVCFHFDSTTGRYTLAIVKLLRLLGLLTILVIGGLLIVLTRAAPRVRG